MTTSALLTLPVRLARRAARTARDAAQAVLSVQRVLFFEGRVGETAALAPRFPEGVHGVVVDRPDAEPVRSCLLHDLGMRAEQLRARQARGNVVVLAMEGDRAVAMLWLTFARQTVSEVGSVLQVRDGECITFDEKTLPSHRGRGISPALNRLACQVARDRGASRQLLWRKAGNAPALRVAEKVGQRRIASSLAIMLFGVRVYFSMSELAAPSLELLT